MRKIKLLVKKIDEYISWYLTLICISFVRKDDSESILLVPAANLDGGFGEDIMLSSFIENFAHNRPISIFTNNIIIRDDYLSQYKNIKYIGGFRDRRYLYFLNVIKKHSLVFVIGADIMDGTYGYYLSSDRLKMLDIANRLGVKTGISGFSISNKILPQIRREILKISAHTIIKSRDIDSYNRLKMFVPANRLLLTNDIAFIGPDKPTVYENEVYRYYVEWCKDAKKKGSVIGFCPNSIQANNIGLENYIESTIVLLHEFIKTGNFSIVFLYHDIRPLCANETDKTISERLYNHFKQKNINVFFTPNIPNGVAVKGYLSKVDFTITGRMHLGISGITYFKPMFGVSYANKFEGMVRLFEIDPVHCLIEYTEMEKSKPIVDAFLKNFDSIKSKTSGNINNVRKATLLNYD